MNLNKKNQYINSFGLLIVLSLQVLDNILREIQYNNKITSILKNTSLIFLFIIYMYEIIQLKKRRKKTIFTYELKNILILALIFTILSFYFMIKNKGFNMVTIMGIFKIVFPIVIAYTVLNVINLKYIYNVMISFLVFSILGYVYSIVKNGATIQDLIKIDIFNSYSPFESNFFSTVAISCCIFFGYYRSNKLWIILSTIFCVMTNKRIMVLYSIFLLIFGKTIKKKKKAPKFLVKAFPVVFLGIFIFYYNFIRGKFDDILYKLIGMSANKFTMGRGWLLENILYNNFKSTGFYTSTIKFRSMEMDFPMIYVEMGLMAVIASIFLITKLAKQNYYNFFIIIFCLTELLTSHWFDITYFWIIAYITIGCIEYKNTIQKLE